jgi:drug/metabolite transporter (DMT)-like permease
MRWTLWIALGALCILSGTSWAIPAEMLGELPPLEQQGILFGVMGLIALLFAARRLLSRSIGLQSARLAGAGVGFFGVPAVIVEYARGSVPAMNRSALFAMVPVVVVLGVAAGEWTEREERGARLFLVPALAGLGGLLLLLPLEFSSSARGWMMLAVVCVAVVVVGLASVLLYRLLRGFAWADAVAVVGLVNAAFLLAWSAVHEEIVWRGSAFVSATSLASFVDVVEVLLILWLLREMPPIRFASRYLMIPLVTVLESYVVMRPAFTIRMGFGTVLLAVGAGVLLFGKSGEEETVLSLR